MKVLCPISKWRNFRGWQGQKKARRFLIAGNAYNWVILYETYEPRNRMDSKGKYYPNFHVLLQRVADVAKVCPKEVVTPIVEALNERMGKEVQVDLNQSPEELGRAIDNAFKVNIHRHDNTFARVFKGAPPLKEKPVKEEKPPRAAYVAKAAWYLENY